MTLKIPQTDSIQALAEFWDAHDLVDLDHELEEVDTPVFDRSALVAVPFQPNEVEAVKALAQAQGIDYIDLIRSWVIEKVNMA